MTEESIHDKELKTIKKVYAALGVTLLAAFIPSTIAAIAVGFLFTGTLIAAYSVRKKSAPAGIAANHMTYIIRSIWISSFVGAISTAIAAAYVLANYDPTPIQDCAEDIMDALQDIDTCLSDFIDANKTVFMTGTVIAATPVAGYSLWRMFVGGKSALAGLPIKKPQSWL